MAAACATRLPHPRPGRAVAVGPPLLAYSSGKTLPILQLTCISTRAVPNRGSLLFGRIRIEYE